MSAEIVKLHNIQCNYEKELQNILVHINNVEGENCIKNTSEESNYGLTEENSSQEEIKRVSNTLRNVKCSLLRTNSSKDVKVNARDVKSLMIEVQEKIMHVRQKEKALLKQLKSEEEFLNYDNNEIFYEPKIVEWNKPINLEVFLGKKTIRCNHSCKEVSDFFEFLTKSGGSTNGWNQQDHNIFLKIRLTVKCNQMLIALIHKQLTHKTVNEIERHIDWYNEFLLLKHNKFEAIKNWKSERKLNVSNSPMSDSGNTSSIENHEIRIFDKNIRMKMKQKLTEWKKEKEDKKLQLLFLNENKRQMNFDKERQKENERRVTRKEIDNWKYAKIYNEQLEREQKELLTKLDKKYREREAVKKIKSFQAKDDNYLQRKLIKNQRSRSVEIYKSKIEAVRDPKRLLKPTKQWLSRHSSANFGNTVNSVSYINHVSRLAVPEWRKSLS